ncbi:hypothetical protein M422DRAFT_270206 [Sphaerobolus stellatus SS14]|uniref:Uncharacterized protein n=1 Tax=Sphaerobolus stellatus (strain SS14) TaxID=990650 RepID=A0A0C9UT64_SPHS4|nr:hypothetical protein M422DRAFT_270206 [Sphaerobolus stellatus SS14]
MGERQAAAAVEKGSGPKQLFWIWKIELDLEGESFEEVECTVDGWTNEVIRLEWLHAKASSERWHEETKLLKAERQRVVKSYQWLKKDWLRRKEKWTQEQGVPKGAVAFAARTTATFNILETRAAMHLTELLALS